MSYKKNNTSSSLWNNSRVVTKVLLNVSETGIESTPGIIKNAKKITQSADPTDPSDAVTLKYLKDNYTKENDPNPGFLATTGGTMTGSIDMQGNNITDLAMYHPNGQQDPADHSAITINYVNEQADVIKTDNKITNAVTKLSDIDTQVATLNQLLGITDDPEADNTTAEFLKTSGGTVYGNIDMSQNTVSDLGTPTNQDTKSAINVEFVQAKITSPQMAFLKNNDKKLSHVVSEYFDWLQDPNPVVENPAPDTSQPNAGTSTLPSNNPSSPSTTVTTSIRKYAATPSVATTPDPDPVTPNTTFSETSPLWEEFFSFSDSSRSAMVVQKTGLLTFSMQGSWEHPNLSTNPTQGSGGSSQTPAPTKTQDPISLELTVTAPPAPGTATPPSSTPTTVPDTITKKFTLSSGQSCTLQIPVQAVGSILKLKYVNPNKGYNDSLNNQGNGGATAAPTSGNPTTTPDPTQPDPTPVGITLKSFAWSLVLTPGEIEKTASTTPPAQP
ncbi:hypothetical protein [Chlamydia suis]|uniref:hypothetical protein n=1 Tax=Chlamydia suis TaxID=83559 RepID=UPI0009B0E6F8|nr:hypothetical protein [Chlamydia suis]